MLPVAFDISPSSLFSTFVKLSLPLFHFLSAAPLSVSYHLSKALMDLLVELCSHFHLNPAVHTLELFSPEGDPLGFKPNAPLGSLNVARVLIKEKALEEKVMRRPAPKVPEVSKNQDSNLIVFLNDGALFWVTHIAFICVWFPYWN